MYSRIIVGVRDGATAVGLRALGVTVCTIDYERPETLDAAFNGVELLLLISSSEVGKRAKQHQNIIDAAKHAPIALIACTSILHANTTPIDLAAEHRVTQCALAASGIPFVLLRNGGTWRTISTARQRPCSMESSSDPPETEKYPRPRARRLRGSSSRGSGLE